MTNSNILRQCAGRVRQAALANSNMKLRRLDLASELMGTLTFSWTLATFGTLHTLTGFIGVACVALPFQLMTIRQVTMVAGDFKCLSCACHQQCKNGVFCGARIPFLLHRPGAYSKLLKSGITERHCPGGICSVCSWLRTLNISALSFARSEHALLVVHFQKWASE